MRAVLVCFLITVSFVSFSFARIGDYVQSTDNEGNVTQIYQMSDNTHIVNVNGKYDSTITTYGSPRDIEDNSADIVRKLWEEI
jgi:hypothetical protein